MLSIKWCTDADLSNLFKWIERNRSNEHIFIRKREELFWFYSKDRFREFDPTFPINAIASIRIGMIDDSIVAVQGLVPFHFITQDGLRKRGLWLAFLGSNELGNKNLAGFRIMMDNEKLGFDALSAIDVSESAQMLYERLGYKRGETISRYLLVTHTNMPFLRDSIFLQKRLRVMQISYDDLLKFCLINSTTIDSKSSQVEYDSNFLAWRLRQSMGGDGLEIYKLSTSNNSDEFIVGYFDCAAHACIFRVLLIQIDESCDNLNFINKLRNFGEDCGVDCFEYFDSSREFGEKITLFGFNDQAKGNIFPRYIRPMKLGPNYLNYFYKAYEDIGEIRVTSLDSDIMRPS